MKKQVDLVPTKRWTYQLLIAMNIKCAFFNSQIKAKLCFFSTAQINLQQGICKLTLIFFNLNQWWPYKREGPVQEKTGHFFMFQKFFGPQRNNL